jgi:hypothetical protein
VFDEIGGDELIDGAQIVLIPHLLVETTLRSLVFLGGHGSTSF